jgi:hypothetical protein
MAAQHPKAATLCTSSRSLNAATLAKSAPSPAPMRTTSQT